MKKKVSLFGYFGAKAKLAEELADFMDTYKFDTFIDGFTGSGAVTLNKRLNKYNICNDLDIRIYLILKMLSDPKTSYEFIQRMYDTRYDFDYYTRALDEWAVYKDKKKSFEEKMLKCNTYISKSDFDRVNNAWKTVIPEERAMELAVFALAVFKQSRNGLPERGWKGFQDGTEGISYIDRMLNLMDASEKLHNVEVYNVNTLMLIDKFKNDDKACIYLDPPYEMKARGKSGKKTQIDYQVEMNDKLQRILVGIIKDIEPRVLLSGYRDKEGKSIYDDYLLNNNGNGKVWGTCKFAEVVKSNTVTKTGESKPMGEEHVWYNW